MPDYLYAVASALLWAISTPIINSGIRNPSCGDARTQVLAGLMTSMTAGVCVLGGIVLWLDERVVLSTDLMLAGVFTFPLATGVYYFSGVAFSGRADIASLFSKVKPLFSFGLAALALHEPVTRGSMGSVSLIALGTLLLLVGSGLRKIDFGGVLLGLSTAALWALGEFFMATGVRTTHPVAANLSALMTGALLFVPFAIAPLRRVAASPRGLASLTPFLFHGIISFGIAYSLFFFSIERIGLGHSVLINAFWPVLGILITSVLRRLRGQPFSLPVIVIVAAGILLAGSLLQALALITSY